MTRLDHRSCLACAAPHCKIEDMRVVVEAKPTGRWPLGRRSVAGLVFALALVTVIATPGMLGRNVSGTATAGLVPDGPEAGACLAPITAPVQLSTMVDAVGPVACSEPHSTEVVAVGTFDTDAYPLSPGQAADQQSSDMMDRVDDRCRAAVTRYVSGVRSSGPMGRLPPRAKVRVAVPSSTQWAYGQRWFACEVLPATNSYPIAWTGTAHLAGLSAPPAPFATCALTLGGEPVDCGLPHSAEQLTWNDSSADGPQGCYERAAALMKTSDPTYHGALVVANRRVQWNVECWVATQGGATLIGSLIGYGSRALPLG